MKCAKCGKEREVDMLTVKDVCDAFHDEFPTQRVFKNTSGDCIRKSYDEMMAECGDQEVDCVMYFRRQMTVCIGLIGDGERG